MRTLTTPEHVLAQVHSHLIARHTEEFEELYRIELLKNGLEFVTLRRTITKRVSETEARILERNGWERIPDE